MKTLEFDMMEVKDIIGILKESNQVNKAFLDGRIEDSMDARRFLGDNINRINICILKLSNIHESLRESIEYS